jgi:hypothetical protein
MVPGEGSSYYDWSISGGSILSGQGSGCIQIQAGYQSSYLNIEVTPSNTCGNGPKDQISCYINSDDGGGPLSVQPNPADNQLTVILEEEESLSVASSQTSHQSSQEKGYIYYLYDLNYQLIRQFTSDLQTVQIKTNDLEEGFYILHVVQGEKVYKAKIEVRH